MARTKTRRHGPRPTLRADDPDPAKAALAKQGFAYVGEAAKRVKISVGRFIEMVNDGLSSDPKALTLEKLKPLGDEFLDALRKKGKARHAVG